MQRKPKEIKKYCVYIHRNKINQKVYVGQTCNIKDRWRCNGKNYFNSIKFFNAIKKYGWDNFEHIILFVNLTKKEADFREQQFIEIYDSIRSGYNLKTGGSRGELSEESLAKMSKSLKEGYINHPERRKKIAKNKSTPNYTDELRNRMSLHNRKNAKITINNTVGSLRKWAKIIGVPASRLTYIYRKKGKEEVTSYIIDYLEKLQKK